MKIDDKTKAEMIEGARKATPQNPSLWKQIADYYAGQNQTPQVERRPIDKNTPKGDY